MESTVIALLSRIGLAERRQREVGTWIIDDEPMGDGDRYQDWGASHRVALTDRARIRFFIPPPGSTTEVVTRIRRVVEYEYRLTKRLAHDNVLPPRDVVDGELGAGLVFTADESFRRLDLWLAEHPDGVALSTQLSVVRQVAEGLAYAHRHQVVHRGLCPAAVQVRDRPDGAVHVLVGDWEAAATIGGARLTGLATTQHPDALAAARSTEGEAASARGRDPGRALVEAFQAPESLWAADADRVRLDVFALGALAYYVMTGRPPAPDRATLRARLQHDDGLDLAADLPQVQSGLRTLVLAATRPSVSDRLSDVGGFLALLDAAERALSAPPADSLDPLEAPAGSLLDGRFRLERRLGTGSTAVGLLVVDLAADATGGARRVLKVPLNEAAATRLADEAAVLRGLRHPRLVTLLEECEIGGRQCLLLSSAGEETLADALRSRPRLSLDLLDRWGSELLEAVVALESAGTAHRDIKPANLGVREGRRDGKKHLVLFDFSLARAAADAVTAGTPPYLDPFLDAPGRGRHDSAAERYAAAVVLFEMATGHTPVFGDGLSHPQVGAEEATVEPEHFDESVAARLVPFFRQALARDASARFHTAADQLAAWTRVFTVVATTADTVDERQARAEAASAQTPLREAGLSARAISALEPLAVHTVGDLAVIHPARLNIIRGVAEPTRREIRERARVWRTRFGPARDEIEVVTDSGEGGIDVLLTAAMLAGMAEKPERRAARLLLGLDAGLRPFSTSNQVAGALGVQRSRARRLIATLHDLWVGDADSRAALEPVRDAVFDALERRGGVAGVDELTDEVAAAPPIGPGSDADAGTRRVLTSLLAVALGVLRGADDRAVEVRRGGDGHVSIIATDAALLDAADAASRRVDELVAVDAQEQVIPGPRAAELLRTDLGGTVGLDDERLVRLAAALSRTARVSGRGELHGVALSPARAAGLALAGLAAQESLTPQEVRDRVRIRFPALAPLPDRPRLDVVLASSGLALRYDEAERCYRGPAPAVDTRGLASRQTTRTVAPPPGSEVRGHVAQRLTESTARRSFLALGIRAQRADRAVDLLVERHGAHHIDVTRVLLTEMREAAETAGLAWDVVLAADTAADGSRDSQGLHALVRRGLERLQVEVRRAGGEAAAGRPLLLTDLAPLARYGHLGTLAEWTDLTAARRVAVWVLVPQLGGPAGALIDGRPLPLAAPGQFLTLDEVWLSPDPGVTEVAV